ncbi:MAG: L-histidine N(alpha)-methyltransferase [Actinomycetota bacterium]
MADEQVDRGAPIAPIVDVHLSEDDLDKALRIDVEAGLTASPKSLPPKWFYDERGSELFDQITNLVEYYPTEAEREILLRHAPEIVDVANAETIIELGSGTSDKTRAILDAATDRGTLRRFVPFDVSEAFLRQSVDRLAALYPATAVHGVVGDFDHHLAYLPSGDRQLMMFLGGTLGNYGPVERKTLLATIVGRQEPGDHVLLGVDLVKDIDRLELAYDDPHGVTAAFNMNVLHVVNRQLDADFDVDRFAHVARFDTEHEWMDLSLRSLDDQRIHIGALGIDIDFAAGELLRTEVSCKFRRARFENELRSVGLEPVMWRTDTAGDFAVSLSRVL